MPRAVEHFFAFGHPEVVATHKTTFEITAEEHLSSAGNCIIAVRSEKGASDLSPDFKALMQIPGSGLSTTLTCRDVTVTILASGSPGLLLDHPTDLVWRRSAFTCGRTIGTYASHTAITLPRELIELLREEHPLEVCMIVEAELSADSDQDLSCAGFCRILSG